MASHDAAESRNTFPQRFYGVDVRVRHGCKCTEPKGHTPATCQARPSNPLLAVIHPPQTPRHHGRALPYGNSQPSKRGNGGFKQSRRGKYRVAAVSCLAPQPSKLARDDEDASAHRAGIRRLTSLPPGAALPTCCQNIRLPMLIDFQLLAATQEPYNPENKKGLHFCRPFESCGGRGRNRTADTGIFNPLLYQLSYSATLFSLALSPARTRILRIRGSLGKRISQKFSHPMKSAPNTRSGKADQLGGDHQAVVIAPPAPRRRRMNAKSRISRCGSLFEELVERRRIELPTFALRTRRSPS